MKLFIWEGKGISSAYHDDGTLVVLAGTVEQAREVAIARRDEERQREKEHIARWDAYHASLRAGGDPEEPGWLDRDPLAFDGYDKAIAREPDRVVELDDPTVVAFNGGGYD